MPANAQLREFVIKRAGNRCEYCAIHQDDDKVFRFPVDRIVSGQHRGTYSAENTALACHNCNKKKGPNIAGISPDSGEIVPLFNPRRDAWEEHFVFDGAFILGRTPTGRATVDLLDMNAPDKVRLRAATEYPKVDADD